MEVFEKLFILNTLVFLMACPHLVVGGRQLYPRNSKSQEGSYSLYPNAQSFINRGEDLEAQPSYYKQRTVHYYYSPRKSSKALPYLLLGLAAGSAAIFGGALAAGTGKK